MQIALIHYAYPPVIGGVERIMEEHAGLFIRHRHEVTVLCHQGGRECPSNIRVLPLPAGSTEKEQADALRPVLETMDVVFVHNVMTMPFHPGLTLALESLAPQLPQTRFIAWVHDVAARNPDLAPAPDWASRSHAAFEYVAVSELRRRQWKEASGVESSVIPNGIDPARILGLPDHVAALAAQFSLLDGRIVLLHPTRLLRRKNVELGLAVVAELTRLGHPATLLITGPSDPHNAAAASYAAWLRQECARTNAPALFLSDHFSVGDAELAALYRLADALFFPSRQEGFGLPVLEAALHRLPVFCSDIEPLQELSGQHACRFSPEAEPADLAAAITEKLGQDAAFQARRRALAEFSWPAIYKRHIAPLLLPRTTAP
jgi:mannosylglucosylglycerate synthase